MKLKSKIMKKILILQLIGSSLLYSLGILLNDFLKGQSNVLKIPSLLFFWLILSFLSIVIVTVSGLYYLNGDNYKS